jgi:hypothetical protein
MAKTNTRAHVDDPVAISVEDVSPTLPADEEKHAVAADKETARYTASNVMIDEATNKRLFWKINRRVLLIMIVTYFCQSLDKGTLNFSSIMGIEKDAHLKGPEVLDLRQTHLTVG